MTDNSKLHLLLVLPVLTMMYYPRPVISSRPRPPPPARVQTLYGSKYFDHTQYSPSDGGNLAVGALYLTLTQGSLSMTTLSEDNPLDIPEFISSIGGFWGECTGPSGPREVSADDFVRRYLG